MLKYTANEYLPNKFFSHFKVLYIILPNFYFTSNKVILLNMDRNKKNRVQISKEIKKKICEDKRNEPSVSGVQLARRYNISEQAVSNIIKGADKYLEIDTKNDGNNNKYSRYPEIEEVVLIWLEQFLLKKIANFTLTGDKLTLMST